MAEEIRVPKLGMSATEVILAEWMFGDGEQVSKGDIIYTAETDKTTVEIEAQASGVPVVGSGETGLAEVIEHGVTGSLHNVGDVEAMAAASIEILAEEGKHADGATSAEQRKLRRDASSPAFSMPHLEASLQDRFKKEVHALEQRFEEDLNFRVDELEACLQTH